MKRDSQRTKVYRAEYRLIREMDAQPLSFADAEALMLEVWHCKRWTRPRAVWDHMRPTLRFVNTRSSSVQQEYGGFPGDLILVQQQLQLGHGWARTAQVVVHETVHAIQVAELCNGFIAAHGPEFTKLYREAVEWHLGFEHGEALRRAFRLGGVR